MSIKKEKDKREEELCDVRPIEKNERVEGGDAIHFKGWRWKQVTESMSCGCKHKCENLR